MMEMAWLGARAGFDVVVTMGQPSRACTVAALSEFHNDHPPATLFEKAGGSHLFGGKTRLETNDHPQNLLPQSRGWDYAALSAQCSDRLMEKLTGRKLAVGHGCEAWVNKQPHVPSHDGSIEYLQGIRQMEYRKKEMLTWDQTREYASRRSPCSVLTISTP